MLFANGLVVANRALTPVDATPSGVGDVAVGAPNPDASPDSVGGEVGTPVKGASSGSVGTPNGPGKVIQTPYGTITIPRGTRPPGVTDDTIEVVYYWKGERTQTSPYLNNTDAEGQNLDESVAFMRYIEYINSHDGDGTTFMGIPIELHGRKLKGTVVAPPGNANGGYAYGQMAERIASELKPFAAIAAHGGLSTYVCPRLAEEGIHNLATYDLGGKGGPLAQRTGGYCTPAGMSWERQILQTIRYLKDHKNTQTTLGADRVYGVIYSVYPGLSDVGPAMVKQLKAAGIPIAEVARLPDDLSTAQQQAPFIIQRMRSAGVNTLIMPDAGAPLNITHAAQATQYSPDYFVWPCSGTDVTAMVRLFNAAQWARASGMTCYDREFNPDLTNDDKARKTEWWKAYQEMAPSKQPPSQSPLVYAGLAQLIAGVSKAGRNLTVESFRAGLDATKPYRYDAIDGRTNDPTNMLITLGTPDRSMIGDAAFLRWDATAREQGGTQGAYRYPEDRRYKTSK
jgi:hypothetical protein